MKNTNHEESRVFFNQQFSTGLPRESIGRYSSQETIIAGPHLRQLTDEEPAQRYASLKAFCAERSLGKSQELVLHDIKIS